MSTAQIIWAAGHTPTWQSSPPWHVRYIGTAPRKPNIYGIFYILGACLLRNACTIGAFSAALEPGAVSAPNVCRGQRARVDGGGDTRGVSMKGHDEFSFGAVVGPTFQVGLVGLFTNVARPADPDEQANGGANGTSTVDLS